MIDWLNSVGEAHVYKDQLKQKREEAENEEKKEKPKKQFAQEHEDDSLSISGSANALSKMASRLNTIGYLQHLDDEEDKKLDLDSKSYSFSKSRNNNSNIGLPTEDESPKSNESMKIILNAKLGMATQKYKKLSENISSN